MRLVVLAGALAVASTTLGWTAHAQSLPNISGIKQTTNRAVAKTNAHTLAMTNVDSAANATKAPAAKHAPAPNGCVAPPPSARSRARPTRHARTASAQWPPPSATAPGAEMDTAGKVVLRREVFAYEQSGRRDPFVSLMTVGELRPMISDLAISGILIDPTGRNSVAVLRDVTSKRAVPRESRPTAGPHARRAHHARRR